MPPAPELPAAAVARRALLYLLPVLALIGALVAVLHHQELRYARELHAVQGQHAALHESEAIGRALATVRSDLMYLRRQEALADFVETGQGRARLEADYQLFAGERGVYHQVRLLDATGQEVIRVNHDSTGTRLVAPEALQAKGDRYYFQAAWRLAMGRTFVSRFDLNVERQQLELPWRPAIRFATPVADRAGTRRGVLVLNYLGADLLAELERSAAQSPGQVVLLNAEGYYLTGVQPERAWGFVFGREADRFGVDHPEAWARIRSEANGHFEGAAGLFSFASITPSTAAGPLRVVSFVPRERTHAVAARLLHPLLWVAAIAALALAVLTVYIARARELHDVQERCITESELRLRVLSMALLEAQERERRAIARDLHDDLGQILTAIKLHLHRAAASGKRRDAALAQASDAASTLMSRVHAIAARLRPAALDDLGLEETLRAHLEDFERSTRLSVDLRVRGAPAELRSEVAEHLYRIVQEALSNVSKHASASAVRVELEASATARLLIEDDGVGFDAESVPAGRLGLLGIRERAELLGGRFELRTAPGAGTRVEVELPC